MTPLDVALGGAWVAFVGLSIAVGFVVDAGSTVASSGGRARAAQLAVAERVFAPA